MTVFDSKPRSRTEGLRPGEDLFAFYDAVSRDTHEQFRQVVNGWAAELPECDRAGFAARMRAGEFAQALIELIVHAALIRAGHEVELHPPIDGTRKVPDFLACGSGGDRLFYVEVTTINHSAGRVAHDNREAVIYNALNRAQLPDGYWLWYDLVRAGPSSPSARKLVKDIQAWAATADIGSGSADHRFDIDGWIFDLTLLAGDAVSGRANTIAGKMLSLERLTPADDLRGALDAKATRYGGTLDLPYIIVVADLTERFTWGPRWLRDVMLDTFLGEEVDTEAMLLDGSVRSSVERQPYGFWSQRGRQWNRQVSAVLVIPDGRLWRLREPAGQALMAINPWAERTFDEAWLPLPCLAPRIDRWAMVEGTALADLVGLPDPWPPTAEIEAP